MTPPLLKHMLGLSRRWKVTCPIVPSSTVDAQPLVWGPKGVTCRPSKGLPDLSNEERLLILQVGFGTRIRSSLLWLMFEAVLCCSKWRWETSAQTRLRC